MGFSVGIVFFYSPNPTYVGGFSWELLNEQVSYLFHPTNKAVTRKVNRFTPLLLSSEGLFFVNYQQK